MNQPLPAFSFFFFNDTATTEIYTLSLHDALPISYAWYNLGLAYKDLGESEKGIGAFQHVTEIAPNRSEEHTSELQSQSNLVCRLLLEKKKKEICFHASMLQVIAKHTLVLEYTIAL